MNKLVLTLTEVLHCAFIHWQKDTSSPSLTTVPASSESHWIVRVSHFICTKLCLHNGSSVSAH